MRFFTLLIILGLVGGWVFAAAAPSHAPLFAPSSQAQLFYADGFETETNWQLDEELVTSCYQEQLGSNDRSTDVAAQGQYSMRTWANEALSLWSNHIISGKKVTDTGQTGVFTYRLQSYIASETYLEGQTGPEFSLQNTRHHPTIGYRTAIAGIQYIANPYFQTGDLQVWHNAAWVTLGTITPTLAAATWYTFTLEADFSHNVYHFLTIEGNGDVWYFDLSGYQIAEEPPRGLEEAFVVTVENENLWNNCGTAGVFDYKVYYDEIAVWLWVNRSFLPLLTR